MHVHMVAKMWDKMRDGWDIYSWLHGAYTFGCNYVKRVGQTKGAKIHLLHVF